MNRFVKWVAAGALCLGMQQARAEMEARLQAIIDPTQSEESRVGALIGLGAPLNERVTVGGYGYLVTTDRDMPRNMDRINGIGVFGECDLSEGYALMPFVGARAGLLSASGPGYGTAGNLAGTVGLKYHFTDRWTTAFSVNYLWASEEYYDYEHTADGKGKASNSDVTLDLGFRWVF
jgi:hypothetical protein